MTLVPDLPPEGVRTRAEVLRAVTRLIGEHGIDGMTMRQVARATAMSTGTINYHFTNKRSLILAALDAAPAAPATGEAGGPLDRLQALFRGFILEDPDRRAWWRFWVEVTAQAARDADLRDRQRNRMEAQRREVEDLVSLGVQRGELRAELDAGLIAEPLLALAHGLAIQQLISPDAATVRRASDALEGSIREISAR
ncbi:MAG: TetR/AcrR family transcriptional regulator [Dehalococcoidia bacterium]